MMRKERDKKMLVKFKRKEKEWKEDGMKVKGDKNVKGRIKREG